MWIESRIAIVLIYLLRWAVIFWDFPSHTWHSYLALVSIPLWRNFSWFFCRTFSVFWSKGRAIWVRLHPFSYSPPVIACVNWLRDSEEVLNETFKGSRLKGLVLSHQGRLLYLCRGAMDAVMLQVDKEFIWIIQMLEFRCVIAFNWYFFFFFLPTSFFLKCLTDCRSLSSDVLHLNRYKVLSSFKRLSFLLFSVGLPTGLPTDCLKLWRLEFE